MKITHLLLSAGLALGGHAAAKAERLLGLTLDNRIVGFDSATPTQILTSSAILGLSPGDRLIGLDLRPADRQLYTATSTGSLFRLDREGRDFRATPVGTLTAPLAGSQFAFDFNPVPDRLRVVSDSGQNLRVNVDGGATIVDGPVSSDTGPVQIVAAAYTNNVAGATTTTLYALDATNSQLLRSTNPNAGLYSGTNLNGDPFGPLGLSFTTANNVSFDISGRTGATFANIDSLLWSINLMTGEASTIGIIGAGPVSSLTASGVIPEPSTWAMLVVGFGIVGAGLRRRSRAIGSAIA